jgi:hypothetical protein
MPDSHRLGLKTVAVDQLYLVDDDLVDADVIERVRDGQPGARVA